MATAQALRRAEQGCGLRPSVRGPLLLRSVPVTTNLAALVRGRGPVGHRHLRVPAIVPVLGIASCVLLLSQQEGSVWLYGPGLLVGVVLLAVARATSDLPERRGPS